MYFCNYDKMTAVQVDKILDRYKPMLFYIHEDEILDNICNIFSNDTNNIINTVVGQYRRKNKTLKDEILPYTNIEIVFVSRYTTIIIDDDKTPCLILEVKCMSLNKWLKNLSNHSIHEILYDDNRFRARQNRNWIFIPPNINILVSYNSKDENARRASISIH